MVGSHSPAIRDVWVVDAVRTPIGRYGGVLSSVRPDDLLAHVLQRILERSEVEPSQIDEVVAGCATQAGEDARNVARMALLLAGYPEETPGLTLNRLCASGLSAVVHGYRAIALGDADAVVAGGVESMSRAPYVMTKPDQAFKRGAPEVADTSLGWRFINDRLAAVHPPIPMGETAERLVDRFGITRTAQDEFAYRSHRLAGEAWASNRYQDHVVAVEAGQSTGETVEKDEGIRPDTSMEALGQLRPVFRQGGTVTAGNSSSLNDGAGAVLLASTMACERWGITPSARVVATAQAGVDPSEMGIGPVPATRSALERAGWVLEDLDTVEINEAFAAQCLAVLEELPIPMERVNPDGGAISLGHPLGMSGIRLVATVIHRMRKDRSVQKGLATACVGVGQGESILLERA